MVTDRIVSGTTAQRHLLAGIDTLADVLAVTLGPVGRNVVVENELTHQPEVLESAAEIARRLTSLSASHQNTGAMLLRHLVWRVVRHAGDGGATAAVFARALYQDALRLVAAGMDPAAAVRRDRGGGRRRARARSATKRARSPPKTIWRCWRSRWWTISRWRVSWAR